jgi:hypothetical protein
MLEAQVLASIAKLSDKLQLKHIDPSIIGFIE